MTAATVARVGGASAANRVAVASAVIGAETLDAVVAVAMVAAMAVKVATVEAETVMVARAAEKG